MQSTEQSINAMDHAKSALTDTRQAVLSLITDPMGSMNSTYNALGQARAFAVGLVCAGGFALCLACGMYRLQQSLLGFMAEGGVILFLKMLLGGMVPPASLFLASLLARKAFRTHESASTDMFIVGTALLPIAVCLIAVTVLGAGAYQLLGILLVFALTYMILMLFCGYVQITGMRESRAALIVPLVILASGWIIKFAFTSLLGL